MRLMRYKLTLAEFPYLITGSETADGMNGINGRESLPIKFIVSERDKNDLATKVTDLIYDEKSDESDFAECYCDILFGQHSDWYLCACEVNARSIVLNYYNQTNNEDGAIVFDSVDQPIQFQLAVPHRNGKPDSIYDVKLCAIERYTQNPEKRSYEARVIEYYADGRRELQFLDDSNQVYDSDKYVYVDEYVDL